MLAAGSRYETPESKGIAHFAEHMFFKGTERRPTARTISTEIDAIGGSSTPSRARSSPGTTSAAGRDARHRARRPRRHLLHSRFDEAEITKEKGVILEEMNVYLDTPQRYVGNVYDRLLYADQPLGWDIIGTHETIEASDTRDVHLVPRLSGTSPNAWSSESAAGSATSSPSGSRSCWVASRPRDNRPGTRTSSSRRSPRPSCCIRRPRSRRT